MRQFPANLRRVMVAHEHLLSVAFSSLELDATVAGVFPSGAVCLEVFAGVDCDEAGLFNTDEAIS